MKNLKNLDVKELPKQIEGFFAKKEKTILLLIFVVLLGYCGYLWYIYVYDYKWEDAKKQEYITAKNAGVIFNKGKFERVISSMNARKDEYQRNLGDLKDIFKIKQ